MTNDLVMLRKSLDDIDGVIVAALGERARLARDMARAKSTGDAPVRDLDRETALLQHRSAVGERLGLDPAFVRRIFREILERLGASPAGLAADRRRRGAGGTAGGLPGNRGRLRLPGGLSALRRRESCRLVQGVRHVSRDARGRHRGAGRSRSAPDREHHRRLGLRVV